MTLKSQYFSQPATLQFQMKKKAKYTEFEILIADHPKRPVCSLDGQIMKPST